MEHKKNAIIGNFICFYLIIWGFVNLCYFFKIIVIWPFGFFRILAFPENRALASEFWKITQFTKMEHVNGTQ